MSPPASSSASLPTGLNSHDLPVHEYQNEKINLSSQNVDVGGKPVPYHHHTSSSSSSSSSHERQHSDSTNSSQQKDVSLVRQASKLIELPKTYYQRIRFFLLDRDYHLYIFTAAFTFLFFAYPIQGVQTLRFPSTGSFILLVLYGAYGITAWYVTVLV
jgi:hypothetical protein